MRIIAEKYRLPTLICVLLLAGFLTTSITAYLVTRDVVRRGVTEQALPLTGDSVYAQIHADFLRPTFIASMMADDSFVLDWLHGGEADPDQLTRYLAQIKQKYGVLTSFLVSEHSRRYYSADGGPRLLDDNDPHDRWFQRVRAADTPLVTEIDTDPVHGDQPTVFLNYRVLDGDGSFLGVTGVGLRLNDLVARIDHYQALFGCRIYLVDANGKITLTGSSGKPVGTTLAALPGLRELGPQLLADKNKPVQLAYRQNDDPIFVNSRFVPELGWYLVVERSIAVDELPARRILGINLAISAGVMLLILAATLVAINRYQRRLEHMAGTDALTGLPNRQAFELLFRQSALDAERSGRPLSAILFDIDFFKQVNDTYGHQAGDEVLRTIARLAREAVRESDTITRWGGEEFVVLLKECALEQAAAVAEKLRHAIDQHDFSPVVPDRHVTISLGVAQFAMGENAAGFFARTDEALYKAKANGRNRLQVARLPANAPARPATA